MKGETADYQSPVDIWLRYVSGDPKFTVSKRKAVRRPTAILSGWSHNNLRRVRERILAIAPRMHQWFERSHYRWIESGFRPELGLRSPANWPRDVALAWGLNQPPAPGCCRRAFLSPSARFGATRCPEGASDLDWVIFRLYCWGYNAYDMAHDLGHGRDCSFVRAALVRVVRALMQRPDYACWALNPHPSTLPEPLGHGWYRRNHDWIYGQVAIRQPYLADDFRVRQSSYKPMRWPTPRSLALLPPGAPWEAPRYDTPDFPRPLTKRLDRAMAVHPSLNRAERELAETRRRRSCERTRAYLLKQMTSKSSCSTSPSESATAPTPPSRERP